VIGRQDYEGDLDNMNKDVTIAVCIPYYKKYQDYSAFEKSLLSNNIEKLCNYAIIFLTPYWLIYDAVKVVDMHKAGKVEIDLNIIPVSDRRLRSVASYDRFMKSVEFYNLFNAYDYVCICQLDAWVFNDQLAEFAASGYPIIGAPWISYQGDGEMIFLGVGNGGYSLRNRRIISMFLSRRFMHVDTEILRLWINHIVLPDIRNGVSNRVVKLFKIMVFGLVSKCRLLHYAIVAGILLQEDLYVSLLVYSSMHREKMPGLYETTRFSVERYPKQLITELLKGIPSGCHAPLLYDKDYWGRFMPVNGDG